MAENAMAQLATTIRRGEQFPGTRGSLPPLSQAALVEHYNAFGGLETFGHGKSSGPAASLRNAFLSADAFPRELYAELIEATDKISNDDIRLITDSFNFLTSYEVFKRVWELNPNLALQEFHLLVQGFIMAHKAYVLEDFTETLPPIHTPDCKGDEPGNALAHWSCELRRKRFRPDVFRNMLGGVLQDLNAFMAPGIVEFTQDSIMECTMRSRVTYARSFLIRADHWEVLLHDKRDVINALAQNRMLPTAVGQQLVFEHKTPRIRMDVAKYAIDLELLRTIWDSTKSEEIHKAVLTNALFKLETERS